MEKEFTSQLESLQTILNERGQQFEEIDREADAILEERRRLLEEVKEKEHATQRSVYHLEGMVGKLIEIRDFTGAFFNKISYLDTKLPVSQRRLALWMDKLQALQSQWFRTIGRYMTVYAPSGIRNRFIAWERDVQSAAMKARELRGEVSEIQLGGSAAPGSAATAAANYGGTSTSARSASNASLVSSIARAGSSGALSQTPSISVRPHMVTPQSLRTAGEDSEKDVRRFLHQTVTDRADGYVITENGAVSHSSRESGPRPGPDSVSKRSFLNLSSLEWTRRSTGGHGDTASSKKNE
ncbi:hypothetical protein BC939DRAFT_202088 [Gamsiella multidivaricata]|uniref:uncharacterized protein n=1 Tax=Gamsiella multidivaricata TaxID=101098 RepID=UPI00221FB66C|nr:uncharacterized protein BC939DRAFT_202088 [Gamsiella multidivaricata]KAI7821708.1 hypothetical protein BC939DRAFT_202088 [Gamsiella multidivaricata]